MSGTLNPGSDDYRQLFTDETGKVLMVDHALTELAWLIHLLREAEDECEGPHEIAYKRRRIVAAISVFANLMNDGSPPPSAKLLPCPDAESDKTWVLGL
jgi:hypothetical protein